MIPHIRKTKDYGRWSRERGPNVCTLEPSGEDSRDSPEIRSQPPRVRPRWCSWPPRISRFRRQEFCLPKLQDGAAYGESLRTQPCQHHTPSRIRRSSDRCGGCPRSRGECRRGLKRQELLDAFPLDSGS